MIILGLAMCVGIGSSMTPIGHAIVLIPLTFLARDTNINIDVVSYSIVGIITGLLVFIAFILIYKFFTVLMLILCATLIQINYAESYPYV